MKLKQRGCWFKNK